MNKTESWVETRIGLPAEQPEAWETVAYRLANHEILLARPRDPDQLLDDPAVQAQSKRTDYMPYWAYLWPGACLLANQVLSETWPAGTRTIEIGCGLGLAGVAGLVAGLHVTFSDYSPAALALAAHNARLNGFERFETQLVDWKCPPAEDYELVLGADVLYENRCLEDVIRVLDRMLAPSGKAILADPNRSVADNFESLARSRLYRVSCEPIQVESLLGRLISGRIFRLQKTSDGR